MCKLLKKNNGSAQIFLFIILMVLVVVLPILINLAQQNQENRSKATDFDYIDTAMPLDKDQLIIGRIYEYSTGLFGIYNGGGMWTGVEDPNKTYKINAAKVTAGELCKKLYLGDTSVIPDLLVALRKANIGISDAESYKSWVGNRDQFDSLLDADFIRLTPGDAYITKKQEAAQIWAQILVKLKAYNPNNGNDAEIYALFDKYTALVGGGWNKDLNLLSQAAKEGKLELPDDLSTASVCTPNCSCAANTLNTTTCYDGCGGTCVGTVVPKVTPTTSCDDIPTTCSGKDFTDYKTKGDFNCDGIVDILDLSLWKGWYNANKDKCGSLSDFNIWKNAFNKSN